MRPRLVEVVLEIVILERVRNLKKILLLNVEESIR